MTLAEMQGLFADATLLAKVQAACVITCEAIRTEAVQLANHSARVTWARQAINDPTAVAGPVLRCVLAQNAALTVAQIQAANDAAIQTAVNAAVNLFVM